MITIPPHIMNQYGFRKLYPYQQKYSEAIPNFYKFVNSVSEYNLKKMMNGILIKRNGGR